MPKDKVRRKVVVEEVSPEPEKETTTVEEVQNSSVEENQEVTPTDSSESTDSAESSADVKEEVKEEPLKKVDAPTPPPAPMNDNKVSMKVVIFLTAFIAVIVGGLIGGVIVFVNGTKDGQEAEATPMAEASAETEASPTPAAVDKAKYTINIQNGSGIGGQGAAVQKILTDAGFKVGTVGNAKTYDYTKTVIQSKKLVDKDYLAALDASLAKTYVTDDSGELPDSSTVDVIVIVGTEKAK